MSGVMLKRNTLLKTSLRQFYSSVRSLQAADSSNVTFDYKQDETLDNSNQQKKDRPRTNAIFELGDKLHSEIKDKKDINDVYSDLKDGILNFQTSNVSESKLINSFGLNSVISKIIQMSINDQNSKIDPYEILNNACDSHLARPHHFEIVMEYFLLNKQPQDVMSLWIKYLSLITENPKLAVPFRGRNPHKNIVALTTVAYLLLPNNIPDVAILKQILQTKDPKDVSNNNAADFDNSIPVDLITSVIYQNVNQKNQSIALENFQTFFMKYVSENGEWLKSQLENNVDLRIAHNYYNYYKNSIGKVENSEFDSDIVAKFMSSFISLNKPNLAVRCYNDFNPIFKERADQLIKLNNELLIAVAALPANSKAYKFTRVQAIWNSLIKEAGDIQTDSYIGLIEALKVSKNLEELENVWADEIPDALKKNQNILEAYLNAVLRLKHSITLEELEKKLPSQLKNINLINMVLLKNVQSEDFKIDKFNSIYDKYFGSPVSNGEGISKQLPNTETLAIKMLASYTSAADKSQFEFLKSANVSSKSDFNRFLTILQDFINVSQSIIPIRALFTEVSSPLNSRKYKLFIDAEFMKRDGSPVEAEALLSDYLDKSEMNKAGKKSPIKAQFIRELLEAMVSGYCQLSLRKHGFKYIFKIDEYYKSIKELSSSVGNLTLVTILHAYTTLCRFSENKPTTNELRVINKFLKDLEKYKFKVNQSDLRALKNADVTVQESLIKARTPKETTQQQGGDKDTSPKNVAETST
ncbi:Meiotic sister-chromatid recombination- protein 6, mitochondrial [Maudiozyma exigua]|uniref:Meiotic sister-chromatid recombination- protein 6, mitochondrial n=1 Tax=Maudiozyma exigua TaxID=34358 RepID=A0A9P6WGJ4_MAUEX|nr:Meiotic sister-chromatid recombination- protein 6, mitochondrial [Kazachstania exigua]